MRSSLKLPKGAKGCLNCYNLLKWDIKRNTQCIAFCSEFILS